MSVTNSADWGRLYTQGRCMNIGVPWSPEQKQAVYILKVPAEYVRRGCLTQEAADEMREADLLDKESLETKDDDELREKLAEKGVEATADAPRSVLIQELEKLEKKPAKKKAVKKKK